LQSFRSLAPFMLMNFRPRGATECLRAAVENDCALGQQKTQPCMRFSVLLYGKFLLPLNFSNQRACHGAA
jgi:hypothetical protein